MKYFLILLNIVFLTIHTGCVRQPNGHSHEAIQDEMAVDEAHGHDDEEMDENEVHLLEHQMVSMGVKLGHFQELNLSTTVKSNGRLELPPQNKASLSAIVGGRVTSIKVLEGNYVRRGQVLAELENPDFIDLQEEYLLTRNRLDYLEKDYTRQKGLFSDSIASEKVFQKVESEYNATKAKLNALSKRLEMLHINMESLDQGEFHSTIPIRSPINGYVRLIEINMGKYVLPEQEMFEIVDNEHIHIDLMVYERDLRKVKTGQRVVFSLTTNPDSVFTGRIFSLGKAFEQDMKAMVAHAEIENKQGNLLPGMYVDARIITDDKAVRALPDDALITDGGLQYIFILQPMDMEGHAAQHEEGDEHVHEYVFRKMEVNTGASDIGFTEIIPVETVADDASIVTAGAFYLHAEMKKGEGGHGHHH